MHDLQDYIAHITKLLGQLTADDLQQKPFPLTLDCPLLKRATWLNITPLTRNSLHQ